MSYQLTVWSISELCQIYRSAGIPSCVLEGERRRGYYFSRIRSLQLFRLQCRSDPWLWPCTIHPFSTTASPPRWPWSWPLRDVSIDWWMRESPCCCRWITSHAASVYSQRRVWQWGDGGANSHFCFYSASVQRGGKERLYQSPRWT